MKLLKALSEAGDKKRHDNIVNSLLRQEAKLGGKLFGPTPGNRHREFFCLDEQTWVWHEEWTDSHGERRSLMTRYVVRSNKILKTIDDGNYSRLSSREARHFYQAVRAYQNKVNSEYQQLLSQPS